MFGHWVTNKTRRFCIRYSQFPTHEMAPHNYLRPITKLMDSKQKQIIIIIIKSCPSFYKSNFVTSRLFCLFGQHFDKGKIESDRNQKIKNRKFTFKCNICY